MDDKFIISIYYMPCASELYENKQTNIFMLVVGHSESKHVGQNCSEQIYL